MTAHVLAAIDHETVTDLLGIGAALREWGYAPEDVTAIPANMLRVLRAARYRP